jgi:hypothetical protein
MRESRLHSCFSELLMVACEACHPRGSNWPIPLTDMLIDWHLTFFSL